VKVSVITFPGSNCDHDAYEVFSERGHQCKQVWHKDTDLSEPDLVVLPGGFSYGDYLRCGALARFSPIVREVVTFANKGGLVIGICNGFQILTECGLLPGTLMMNRDLEFICQHQFIRVERSDNPWTYEMPSLSVLDIPIAHKEGNYFISNEGLQALKDNAQIVFRYCDAEGKITTESNPNGSLDNIAGICNVNRNVLGMMPHPERATGSKVQGNDGAKLISALEKYYAASV
jgi:phosphoribosylformylglycinamidine synthase subunit PurQ / glutaminase